MQFRAKVKFSAAVQREHGDEAYVGNLWRYSAQAVELGRFAQLTSIQLSPRAAGRAMIQRYQNIQAWPQFGSAVLHVQETHVMKPLLSGSMNMRSRVAQRLPWHATHWLVTS